MGKVARKEVITYFTAFNVGMLVGMEVCCEDEVELRTVGL